MKARPIVLLFVVLLSSKLTSSQIPDQSSRAKSLVEFKTAGGVRAVLLNFYYETQFQVLSFDITFMGDGFEDPIFYSNVGGAWNERCQQYVSRCRIGTEVIIENIRVRGPDNRTRKLNDILVFKLR